MSGCGRFGRWTLGRGHQGDGDGPAEAGDGIGVAHGVCVVGQLGIFVDDGHQRGPVRRWLPDAPAGRGEQFGPGHLWEWLRMLRSFRILQIEPKALEENDHVSQGWRDKTR